MQQGRESSRIIHVLIILQGIYSLLKVFFRLNSVVNEHFIYIVDFLKFAPGEKGSLVCNVYL